MPEKKFKPAKQLTLDKLPAANAKQANPKPAQEKQIIITQIESTTKEDELALKIAFKLQPSRLAFSKVKADLWFDNTQISSVLIRVLQGPLATDESEYKTVLDMKGIPAGAYCIKVEMYELWSSGEKLLQTVKEVTVDYVPQTRASRLVKVPTVRSVAGADLAVVSDSEKDVYLEMEKTMKKEQQSKRDDW